MLSACHPYRRKRSHLTLALQILIFLRALPVDPGKYFFGGNAAQLTAVRCVETIFGFLRPKLIKLCIGRFLKRRQQTTSILRPSVCLCCRAIKPMKKQTSKVIQQFVVRYDFNVASLIVVGECFTFSLA